MAKTSNFAGLQGLPELDKKLAELGVKTEAKILRQAVREAMRPALNDAKRTVPVGTEAHTTYKGRLVAPGFAKRSLRIVTELNKTTGGMSAKLGVRKEAFYAVHFWEYGSPRHPRKPWLGPVLERNAPEILRRIGRAVSKRIDKVKGTGK